MTANRPTFAQDGVERFAAALDSQAMQAITAVISDLSPARAGSRLSELSSLHGLLGPDGAIGRVAASVLGPEARAVRAILFDKNATTNWGLGWHQDRTIIVRECAEVAGFGNWTVKGGLQHVTPPTALLEEMVVARCHLDPIDADNGPLLVALGSHRDGRVTEDQLAAIVDRRSVYACLASPGDIWLSAMLLLHASQPAVNPSRRRVLQIDYAATPLPAPLDWRGV